MSRVFALAVAVVVALTGCTASDQPVATPSPATTTSATTTTTAPATPTVPPTTTPPPPLPTLPAEAHGMTNEGAVAFVGYWFELANYAQSTGDAGPLMSESLEKCMTCESVHQQITDSYSNGGRIVGNLWTLYDLAVIMRENEAYGVQFRFDQTAGLEVDSTGAVRKTLPADTKTLVAVALYTDGAWKMREISNP